MAKAATPACAPDSGIDRLVTAGRPSSSGRVMPPPCGNVTLSCTDCSPEQARLFEASSNATDVLPPNCSGVTMQVVFRKTRLNDWARPGGVPWLRRTKVGVWEASGSANQPSCEPEFWFAAKAARRPAANVFQSRDDVESGTKNASQPTVSAQLAAVRSKFGG